MSSAICLLAMTLQAQAPKAKKGRPKRNACQSLESRLQVCSDMGAPFGAPPRSKPGHSTAFGDSERPATASGFAAFVDAMTAHDDMDMPRFQLVNHPRCRGASLF